MNKTEIQSKLDEMGIAYDNDSTKAELKEMLDEAIEQLGDTAGPGAADLAADSDVDTSDDVEIGLEVEEDGKTINHPTKEYQRTRQATLKECMNQMLGKRFDGKPLGEVEYDEDDM